MANMRMLEMGNMQVRFDLEGVTSEDLDDLQEMISIFRRRFDRQARAYDPAFVEAITGCLDAPLN